MNKIIFVWLMSVGVIHVIGGMALIAIMDASHLNEYGQYFLSQFAVPATDESARLFVGFVQIFAATVVSWGLLFCVGVLAYRKSQEALLKYALLVAVFIWFVLDTTISVYHGLMIHLSVNIPAVILIGAPLYFWRPGEAEKLFSYPADASAKIRYPSIKSVLVTGGTGFIGRSLLNVLLRNQLEVTVLTRNPQQASQKISGPIRWIRSLQELPVSARFDVIVNLAGESLAQGRWNESKKKRLYDSRINTTAALFDWVSGADYKPQLILNASAIGYYGPQGPEPLTEACEGNASFSHDLCKRWEEEARKFESLSIKTVCLRFGVVLARQGGAFEQIKQSYVFKTGIQFGDGAHYFSWVHLIDVLRAMAFIIENYETVSQNTFNITAPEAITYKQLTETMNQQYSTWFTLPVPKILMKILLGEMAEELLLSGQKVLPENLQKQGFEFHYSNIGQALEELAPTREQRAWAVNNPAHAK